MPPEPLDNASNSFPTQILDRTLSSQNMRIKTAHNRFSSSNPLAEKRGLLDKLSSVLIDMSKGHNDIVNALREHCTAVNYLATSIHLNYGLTCVA